MGRKPKNKDTVNPSPENPHPTKERMEHQASIENIKPTSAIAAQLENPQPRCTPLKHPNLPVNGMGTSLERNTPQGKKNQEIKHQKKHHATFIRKKSKYQTSSVRRSDRIKSGVLCTPNSNRGIEYIEDITVSESDRDEPIIQIEQVLQEPQPQPELKLELAAENLSEKSLDEKVDHALLRIEAKIIELVNSKVDGNVGLSETLLLPPKGYRSMYIDSQKKLEALTNENRQLAGKLENALGKIEMLEALIDENQQLTGKLENALGQIEVLEALKDEKQQLTGKLENALGQIEVYEKQSRVLSEPLDKLKDTANAAVSVFANLAKTAEAVINASTPANYNACSASASKRKRNES